VGCIRFHMAVYPLPDPLVAWDSGKGWPVSPSHLHLYLSQSVIPGVEGLTPPYPVTVLHDQFSILTLLREGWHQSTAGMCCDCPAYE
jgi:hypothetical protein